jgi:hypothetical protein
LYAFLLAIDSVSSDFKSERIMSGIFTIQEAAAAGNREMLLLWLQQGTPIDEKDKNSLTALDWSVRNGTIPDHIAFHFTYIFRNLII